MLSAEPNLRDDLDRQLIVGTWESLGAKHYMSSPTVTCTRRGWK